MMPTGQGQWLQAHGKGMPMGSLPYEGKEACDPRVKRRLDAAWGDFKGMPWLPDVHKSQTFVCRG